MMPPRLRGPLTRLAHDDTTGFDGKLARALLGAPHSIKAARQAHSCKWRESETPIQVVPISFSLPEQMYAPVVPPKSQNFSTVVPGNSSTYVFRTSHTSTPMEILASEDNYYKDMSRSLFSFTFKKAGWDCLRHTEIIAAGALPIFTDIDTVPSGTLAAHPIQVYKLLKAWPGLSVQGLPGMHSSSHPARTGHSRLTRGWFTGPVSYKITSPINKTLYQLAVQSLLHIGSQFLTTRGMAQHVMAVANITKDNNVLFVTDTNAAADYQGDTLLHGFMTLMMTNVVDYPRRACMWRDADTFTEGELASHMLHEYGAGFGYGHRLYEPPGVVNRSNVEHRITSGQFDFVVFGITHPGRDFWRELKPLVCRSVPKQKVIFVYGDDFPPSHAQLKEFSSCSHHIFTREMPVACRVNIR